MSWELPDEATRRRVNSAFGTDMYARLADVWDATLAGLPGPVPAYTRNQQTRMRPPESLVGAEGRASPTSGHYLGLQFDVGWAGWSPQMKARIAHDLSVTKIRTATGKLVPITVEGCVNVTLKSGQTVQRCGVPWKPGMQLPARHLHWGVSSEAIRQAGLVPAIRSIVEALRGTTLAGR